MEVLKQISPTRVPVAPNDSPSKNLPSSRARMARMFHISRDEIFLQSRAMKRPKSCKRFDWGARASCSSQPASLPAFSLGLFGRMPKSTSRMLALPNTYRCWGVRRFSPSQKKAPESKLIRAFESFTPPMPFRWISRSLSVTGG